MLDRFQGYEKGGFGTHWKGCHKVHWDCYILLLEKKLQDAERDIKNLTRIVVALEEEKQALYEKSLLVESKITDIAEFVVANIYSPANLDKMKKVFARILKEYKERRKNEE